MIEKIKCNRCQKDVEPILSASGKHLRADCPDCGKYIKFLPQMDIDHEMPFGEYKGKKISEIEDKKYLKWFLKNIKSSPGIKFAVENKLKE